jgi:hypothetical protein
MGSTSWYYKSSSGTLKQEYEAPKRNDSLGVYLEKGERKQ